MPRKIIMHLLVLFALVIILFGIQIGSTSYTAQAASLRNVKHYHYIEQTHYIHQGIMVFAVSSQVDWDVTNHPDVKSATITGAYQDVGVSNGRNNCCYSFKVYSYVGVYNHNGTLYGTLHIQNANHCTYNPNDAVLCGETLHPNFTPQRQVRMQHVIGVTVDAYNGSSAFYSYIFDHTWG